MAAGQLYYEDIEVGDPVRPMFVFMDQMQLIKWAVASGNRGPGHFDMFHTRAASGKDPSVTGQLKTALMEKMIMDWVGPKAWVKRMSIQYRDWDYFFDMKAFSGVVADRREEDGQHVVDLNVQMTNSAGKVTTKGSVTLLLPSRAESR
jgi:hypothetical protein